MRIAAHLSAQDSDIGVGSICVHSCEPRSPPTKPSSRCWVHIQDMFSNLQHGPDASLDELHYSWLWVVVASVQNLCVIMCDRQQRPKPSTIWIIFWVALWCPSVAQSNLVLWSPWCHALPVATIWTVEFCVGTRAAAAGSAALSWDGWFTRADRGSYERERERKTLFNNKEVAMYYHSSTFWAGLL